MDSILNSLIEMKNVILNKFGPVLGYVIIVICALVALSILGFLLKTFFAVAIGLIVAGLVIFGIYKISELVKGRK